MATYTTSFLNSFRISKQPLTFLQPPAVSDRGASSILTDAWKVVPPSSSGAWNPVTYTDGSYAAWNPRTADPGRGDLQGLDASQTGPGVIDPIGAFGFFSPSPVAAFNAAQAEASDGALAETQAPEEG